MLLQVVNDLFPNPGNPNDPENWHLEICPHGTRGPDNKAPATALPAVLPVAHDIFHAFSSGIYNQRKIESQNG